MNKLRQLYDWLLLKTYHPWAEYLLAVLSITESCCFLIPPETMLLPMVYANKKRAWRLAAITSVASVVGAVIGYFIGHFLWSFISAWAFTIPSFYHYFQIVGAKFEENAILSLLLAAFTPIPFKVFTIAAGVYSAKISIWLLIITSIIGRTSRYFILVGVIYIFGPRAHDIIENHFKKMTLVCALLGIVFILYKVLI